MSNIAGKAYAMNVITPVRWYTAWLNKLFFVFVGIFPSFLNGLMTLSLIHYARWVIIGRKQFPHLHPKQPVEDLNYSYMMFFSNFNGSWDQYVDSFTFSIPGGLDLFWKWNVRYSKSVALTPFHNYIRYNQLETIHYYSAYPLAASNDIKAGQLVRKAVIDFGKVSQSLSDEDFQKHYNALLRGLQHDLGDMRPAPIVSMAAQQVEKRRMRDARKAGQEKAPAMEENSNG